MKVYHCVLLNQNKEIASLFLIIPIVFGLFLLIYQFFLNIKSKLVQINNLLSIYFGFTLIASFFNIFFIHILNETRISFIDFIGLIMLFCNYIIKYLREPHQIPDIKLKKPKKKKLSNGNIKIGTIFHNKQILGSFNLSIEDLKRHILIYGQTGTGKTIFVKNFLINFCKKFPNIPFILFEFKGEYNDLMSKIKNINLIKPGINFSFNVFNNDIFNQDVYPEILFDSLKSCQIIEKNTDFSPQMEKVLIDILKIVILNPKYHSWEKFKEILKKYIIRNQNNVPMLKQTSISIQNRLRRYTEGPLSKIFNFSNESDKISQLLSRNCIVDLSSILKLGGNKEDVIFMANLILKWIWENNMKHPSTDKIHHLTIFEDASYVSSKKLLESSKLSSYLEDIALLLRGKGEALISLTTTLDISRNIILNAGSKFFFKFNEKPENVIHYLGLPSDYKLNINELQVGYCLAKIDSISLVFLLKSPMLKIKSKNDKKMLKDAKKKNRKKKKVKPLKSSNEVYNEIEKMLIKLEDSILLENKSKFFRFIAIIEKKTQILINSNVNLNYLYDNVIYFENMRKNFENLLKNEKKEVNIDEYICYLISYYKNYIWKNIIEKFKEKEKKINKKKHSDLVKSNLKQFGDFREDWNENKLFFNVALFRFDDTKGPDLFYYHGDSSLDRELQSKLEGLMDKYSNKVELIIDQFFCSIFFFSIDSEWSRSGKEWLEYIIFGNKKNMKFYFEDSSLEDLINDFINYIKNENGIYKGLYLTDAKRMSNEKVQILEESKKIKKNIKKNIDSINASINKFSNLRKTKKIEIIPENRYSWKLLNEIINKLLVEEGNF